MTCYCISSKPVTARHSHLALNSCPSRETSAYCLDGTAEHATKWKYPFYRRVTLMHWLSLQPQMSTS